MTLEEFKAGYEAGFRMVILSAFEEEPEQKCEICSLTREDFEGETDDSMMVCGYIEPVTPENDVDHGLREFDIGQIKEFIPTPSLRSYDQRV